MKIYPYIEVQSQIVNEHSGISSKTGKPYCIRKQTAYLHADPAKPYPTEMELQLGDLQVAYEKGLYTIDPSSYTVDHFNSLAFSRQLVLARQTPNQIQKAS